MIFLKSLVFLIASGSALLGFELHEHVHSARWRVKTLADSAAIPAQPVSSSIEEQLALPSPPVDETVPRLPSEREYIRITANLIEAVKEFDGDYHLVLEDPATHLRMIAEIPDTGGLAPNICRSQFAAARATIDKLAGKPGFLKARGENAKVEITGLGFFDEPHIFTPKGMAPNRREIHPVLSVKTL